ncbi:MAG: ABC transporter ATP-binding protein [Lachnospiraceae bacterium]|nr:ABC transporter ATP-binding protein [Lachnospiraceae bacterium]
MEFNCSIKGENLLKKYKNFTLSIDELKIPSGFSTALIGENGAGKTTLLNILAGIKLDYKGTLTFYGKYNDKDRENDPFVRESIGYVGTDKYFMPQWTVKQVDGFSQLLFDNYNREEFLKIYDELAISETGKYNPGKKVSSLSDGNKVKLALASVLARDTDMLIMDEPASPLDPLMRDKLCDLIRDYMSKKPGRTVFFSTHNIQDMENVTDYAIIMEHGQIAEEGFVEDLKEKYVLVKGEAKDEEEAKKHLYSCSGSKYGFEGICLRENLDKLENMDIVVEDASLFQISVAVMKKNSKVK